MCDALNELFAEELKEADANGRLIGEQKGAICAYRDMGLSYDEVLAKIKDRYHLTEEKVRELLDKNWE